MAKRKHRFSCKNKVHNRGTHRSPGTPSSNIHCPTPPADRKRGYSFGARINEESIRYQGDIGYGVQKKDPNASKRIQGSPST